MNVPAIIGNDQVFHTFKFNPDAAQWGYENNITSIDTLGGRVVQLLSVQVTDLTINGVAGSREELQRMAKNIKNVMDYQIRTLNPVKFKVFSRKWDMNVYIAAMPQIGWDVAATTYPYQLTLNIEEDLNKIKTFDLMTNELDRLATGIGYNKDLHGGNPEAFQRIVDSLNLNQLGTGNAVAAGVAGVTGDLIPMGGDIIELAKSQIGVPYGGNVPGDVSADRVDPTGDTKDVGVRKGPSFDCSGFTWWCYKQAGIRVPSYAWTTATIPNSPGIKKLANPKDARPGMMILWDGHVGLTVDGNVYNGLLIDSHSLDDPIRVRPVYGGWKGIYYAEGYQYP